MLPNGGSKGDLAGVSYDSDRAGKSKTESLTGSAGDQLGRDVYSFLPLPWRAWPSLPFTQAQRTRIILPATASVSLFSL